MPVVARLCACAPPRSLNLLVRVLVYLLWEVFWLATEVPLIPSLLLIDGSKSEHPVNTVRLLWSQRCGSRMLVLAFSFRTIHLCFGDIEQR